MPQSVPTPLAAALGLVPTVLGGVRRLPGKAVQLPVLAVGSALTRMDAARREYLELADRGERLVAKLRGTSFDELEDRVEDALQGTPLARPYDAVEDALEDAGEAVAGSVSQLTARVAQRTQKVADTAERAVDTAAEATADTASKTADAVQETADKAEKATRKATAKAEKATAKATSKAASKAADKASAKATRAEGKADDEAAGKADSKADRKADDAAVSSTEADRRDDVPEAEQPKGAPTPAATQPDTTRIDTAATADVVETVEQVTAKAVAPEVVDHDQLPLADYDHMTLGSLRGRLRSLDLDQLVQVRNYEKAHADRLPVVTMLDNRIAKLAVAPASEQPSGVPSDRPEPGQSDTPSGSTVSPATGGPALNPPSQGVPTNPAQPRTTGSPGTNPSSNA